MYKKTLILNVRTIMSFFSLLFFMPMLYFNIHPADVSSDHSTSDVQQNDSVVREVSVHRNRRSDIYNKESLALMYHTISQCLSLCQQRQLWPNCTAVDYYHSAKTCYLSSATLTNNSLVSNTNFDFYHVVSLDSEFFICLCKQIFFGK